MDDAALVAAAVAGDKAAFAALYDRFADRIHDFAWNVLRNREDAADVTQDTFVVAAQRLGQLRDPSKVRAWLFAIARNECTRRGKARAKATPSEELGDVAAAGTTPEDAAASTDLSRLVWEAAEGLSERDRMLLDLHVRQGLEGEELGRALGVPAQHGYVMVSRLREQVERSLGSLLIARQGRKDCPELAEILRGWDGRMSPLLRKRVARHVDRCEECARKKAALVNPAALLAAVPIVPAPLAVREKVLGRVELISSDRADEPVDEPWDDEGFPPGEDLPAERRRPPLAWAVAGVVVIAALAGGGTVAARLGDSTEPLAEDRATTTTSEAGGTTTTAAPAGTSTTSPSGPTTTVTVAAGPAGSPASLVLNTPRVDFGTAATTLDASLANSGGTATSWSAAGAPGWLSVSPSAGELAPGRTQRVRLVLDRARAPEDAHSVQVSFAWGSQATVLTVAATVERPPVVSGVGTAHPSLYAEGCSPSQTTVSATVADDSALRDVVLSWSTSTGDTGSATMKPAGGEKWTAPLGPFKSATKVTYTVTATDARGNSATSPARVLVVEDCVPG